MIRINYSGRTGNLLLQNIGASILSKKFNLKTDYVEIPNIHLLNPTLYSTDRVIDNLVNQYDIFHSHVQMGPYGTLMDLLNYESIDNGLYYDGNFQVGDFVKEYRGDILSHFRLDYDNSYLNDVFIHIRLGDVSHNNPGLNYYRECIDKSLTKNTRIYLSTDTVEHEIVKTLTNEYSITIYNSDEISTINFAKNFGTLILSKGTFSWWIGFLSKSKNIMYPIGDTPWYGNIFVFDDWIPIDIKKINN